VHSRPEELRVQEARLRQSEDGSDRQLTVWYRADFNNMLAVVIGGLNLPPAAQARAGCRTHIDSAMEANRARRLTRRLLAFSREEGYRRAIEPRAGRRHVRSARSHVGTHHGEGQG